MGVFGIIYTQQMHSKYVRGVMCMEARERVGCRTGYPYSFPDFPAYCLNTAPEFGNVFFAIILSTFIYKTE